MWGDSYGSGGTVGSWWVWCGQRCGIDHGRFGHWSPEKWHGRGVFQVTVELFKESDELVRPMADCKSMNLIYQLLCTECNTFFWRNPSLPFRSYEWTPVHHNGIEPSCHLQNNPTRSLSKNAGLSVSYTNTGLHPRSHLPPIWNCIMVPTRSPIPTHPCLNIR